MVLAPPPTGVGGGASEPPKRRPGISHPVARSQMQQRDLIFRTAVDLKESHYYPLCM